MSAVITGVVIAGAGVGLAAASAAGAFAPPIPAAPNVGNDVSAQISAEIASTPANYANQVQFNPKFAALNSNIAWNNLFGSPASSTSTPVQQTGYYDQNGNFLGATNPGVAGAQYLKAGQLFTLAAAAAPGSLATAEAAQPRLLGMQTQARTQDIADVQNLGPAAYQSIASYDPQATALLTGANTQVTQRLATNGALDPFTQMSLQQNYRAAEAARGTAGGSSDAAMEAYYQQATMNARQVQNIGLANTQVEADRAYYGDPFQQVLSRTSGGIQPGQPSYTANQPSATAATAALISPSLTALQSQGYQAQVGAQNAGYLSQQAGIASLMSSLGTFNSSLGSYGSGGGLPPVVSGAGGVTPISQNANTDFFASHP